VPDQRADSDPAVPDRTSGLTRTRHWRQYWSSGRRRAVRVAGGARGGRPGEAVVVNVPLLDLEPGYDFLFLRPAAPPPAPNASAPAPGAG
jgi:hypothetical protein